jgi:hypothetical protein
MKGISETSVFNIVRKMQVILLPSKRNLTKWKSENSTAVFPKSLSKFPFEVNSYLDKKNNLDASEQKLYKSHIQSHAS